MTLRIGTDCAGIEAPTSICVMDLKIIKHLYIKKYFIYI
jgi:hypothetical protein